MSKTRPYYYCNVVGNTNIGCKRQTNEDWLDSFECENGLVAVVCDGMGGHVGGFTAKSAALLIYMALLSTAAFSIWTILMKYNPVGKVAVFTFTIPIFGVALSGLLLGEQVLEVKNLIALVLVSAGIIIVNRKE